ncbi:MAG: hypothetical protein OEZ22_09790 [Spirochaetia bacterium]|nr:hypothetical protein [Spirochaetia bacterium]
MKQNYLKYFLLFLLLVFFCGNPEVKRYIVRYSDKGPKKEIKNSILVFSENDFFIYIEPVDHYEMEELAEKLELFSTQKHYRLPGLTFFKFKAVNKSKKTIAVNFFKIYFTDEFNVLYKPPNLDEYYNRYTSVSYDKFNYDYMYSFYLIKKEGKTEPDSEDFYFDNVLPENLAKVPADSEGFQIVPFDFFSSGSRKYTLVLPKEEPFLEEKVTFYYRSIREDLKENLFD